VASGYPDFEGGKRRVYLTADWAAEVGIDKSFDAWNVAAASLALATIDYTVPAGKTLYIEQAMAQSRAVVAADRELNQIVHLEVYDVTAGVYYTELGGNGGCVTHYPVPIKIIAGHRVLISVINGSNHNCQIIVVAHGYEV